MRPSDASLYRSPTTGKPLTLRVGKRKDADIINGALVDVDLVFKIVRGIPRFCPPVNYSQSFGYQWKKWSQNQLDSRVAWGSASASRLFGESQWSKSMKGQRILEAGSGMGRFTEPLAQTGAQICTFDYSTAIEANHSNNAHYENVSFAQADIYAPPFEPQSFDKVLCIGVLQHCPSPKKAFMSLVRFIRPGGEIFIDVYRLRLRCLVFGKYYLRPVTRHLSPNTLFHFVKFHVGWVYPFTGWLQKLIGRLGHSLSWVLAVADYRGVYNLDERALWSLAMLDTFDMLAPAYDRPQAIRCVRKWFLEAGLVDVVVKPGINGIAARGRKPN